MTEVVAESVRFLSGRVPESAHAAEPTRQPQTAAQALTAQATEMANQAAAMQRDGMVVPPPQAGQVAQAAPVSAVAPQTAGQGASQQAGGSTTTQAPSEKRGEVEYAF